MKTKTTRWMVGLVLGLLAAAFAPAATTLSVTPITWDVIGLDSNDVNTGPNRFPIGVRVTNTGSTASGTITVTWAWNSTNAGINLRTGSLSSIDLGSLAAGATADAYFEVEITRNSSYWNTTRRYTITATEAGAGGGTASTPFPREVYVEKLISQSRNGIISILLDDVPIAFGGTMNLMVGESYKITLLGFTAPQGYNQLETFINFKNTIFRIDRVETDYTANTSSRVATTNHPNLYADACGWDADPASPDYRSCIGDDSKSGGTVTTDYYLTIIGGSGTSEKLESLFHDYSGSSYHYNADFGTSFVIVNIVTADIGKVFKPSTILPGGTATLTITLTNPTGSAITGMNFTDTFPSGVTVTDPAVYSATGFTGTPTFSPTAGAGSISFSDGALAANSVGTINVAVTAPAGTYNNTTGHLFISGTTDTGNTASATLTASSAPPCYNETMASWTVPSTATSPPDNGSGAPTTNNTNLTATAAALVPGSTGIRTNTGYGDLYSWDTYGYKSAGQAVTFTIDTRNYSGVSMTFAYQSQSYANGPTSLTVLYSTDGTNYTQFGSAITIINSNWALVGPLDFTGLTSTTGNTYFRITGTGAKNDQSGAGVNYDAISFSGCRAACPPQLSKAFQTDPIDQGSTSTLRFTIGNSKITGAPNQTDIRFTDELPEGLTVSTGSSSQCGGTLTTTAPRTISFSGGSLTYPTTSCTVDVTVTGAVVGAYTNVSGSVSSAAGANRVTNTDADGYGTDTITVNARAADPPIIAMWFGPSTVLINGTTTLYFAITNPNASTTLEGIDFTDVVLPAGLSIADGSFSPSCLGGTLTTTAATRTISYVPGTGGSLDGGESCTFSVTVTAGATAGTYSTNSTTVSSATPALTGNTVSASLTVKNGVAALGLNKQISTDGVNWYKSIGFPLDPPSSQNIYYRFTVYNSGEVTIPDIAVSDPGVTMCFATNPFSLAADTSAFCSTSAITITPSSPDPFTNTATASSSSLGLTSSSSAQYGTVKLTLVKTVDEGSYSSVGDLLHYHYTITNDGTYPLEGPVTVSDDMVTVTVADVSTVGDHDKFLDPGESVTGTATYAVVAGDCFTGESVTNNATATADGVTSNEDTQTVYWTYSPTRVFVSGFGAYEENGRVIVRWETAGERNTLGFHLTRLNPKTGNYDLVNEGLLPALFQSHRGGIYRLRDDGALPGGTYTYQLVEVEIDGKRMTYGPATVAVGVKSADEPALSGASGYDRRFAEDPLRHESAMKSARTAREAARSAESRATGDLIKMAVSEKGLYFLSAADISTLLGIPLSEVPGMIRKGRFSLSCQGEPVAYLPVGKDEGLCFFGVGVDSLYARENVYWLERGEGTLMTVTHGLKPRPSTQTASFGETRHFEENLLRMSLQYEDPNFEQWVWEDLFASGSWVDPPLDLVFEAPGLSEVQTLATIRLHLLGASDAGVANDHRVAVRLNGQPLVENWWTGLSSYTVTAVAPIQAGPNTLTVEAKADANVDYNLLLINSFDVTYQRLYQADRDHLFLRGDGHRVVTVNGFTTPDIRVFNLSDPRQPSVQGATTIRETSGGYSVSLYPVDPDTPYVAVAESGFRRVSGEAVGTFTLSSWNNGADYLVIAPAGLMPAAQRLADYRANQGYKTRVVDVENVLNEFGFGLFDPLAIRSFLSHAWSNWDTPPRFVALVGDGSMDYKDHLGYGGCLVPSPMVATPHGHFVSDNALADFNGDRVPEMAIGRLPVTTPDELNTVIDKIIRFENGPVNRNVVLLADTPDNDAGNFITDSETLSALFPINFVLNKIYLASPGDVGTARSRLFTAINDGTGFFNYVGHSNEFLFSNSWLLYCIPGSGYNDVPRFLNAEKLPVLTVAGCSVGDFSNPVYSTLAEALFFWPFGGISAAWAPTGFSDDGPASFLNREFYTAYLRSGGNSTIGEVVQRALSAYKLRGRDLYLLDIYGLIGDPALRLR